MSLDLLSPIVSAGWDAFNGPLEGPDIDTLYDDIKGFPTVATGVLVASIAAMQSMAWLRPDGSRASPVEESAEWQRVHAMRPSLVWTAYRSPAGLHLDHAEIQYIVLARLESDVTEFARAFPAFGSWPAAAQAGACSMMWAMGSGFAASWPLWSAAARRLDWRACAADCEIRWQDNPGVRPRDMAQQALFLLAAGASSAEARAGWPVGPAADAAARALAAFDWDAAAATLRPESIPPPQG